MNEERLIGDLRKDLVDGQVLVVVGSGVSIQTTRGNKLATWEGLILDGLAHCVRAGLLSESRSRLLSRQLAGTDLNARLHVAEAVSTALGAPRGREFRRWLKESIGKLEPRDPEVIEAVHALRARIATTNYDDLLSRGRGLFPIAWTEQEAVKEFIRNRRDGILHLHGHFQRPESVVLGGRSYRRLLHSRGAQAIQKALIVNKTLLFVGCGDGLSDPHFAALLEWSAALFGTANYRHYCLCRDSERASLQKLHPPSERLFYIPYGDHYEELVPFLRRELAGRGQDR